MKKNYSWLEYVFNIFDNNNHKNNFIKYFNQVIVFLFAQIASYVFTALLEFYLNQKDIKSSFLNLNNLYIQFIGAIIMFPYLTFIGKSVLNRKLKELDDHYIERINVLDSKLENYKRNDLNNAIEVGPETQCNTNNKYLRIKIKNIGNTELHNLSGAITKIEEKNVAGDGWNDLITDHIPLCRNVTNAFNKGINEFSLVPDEVRFFDLLVLSNNEENARSANSSITELKPNMNYEKILKDGKYTTSTLVDNTLKYSCEKRAQNDSVVVISNYEHENSSCMKHSGATYRITVQFKAKDMTLAYKYFQYQNGHLTIRNDP